MPEVPVLVVAARTALAVVPVAVGVPGTVLPGLPEVVPDVPPSPLLLLPG